MKIYKLYRKQFLPISVEKAWEFFSTPRNLAKITPGDMAFVIVSDLKDEAIYEGMNIEYRVKPLLGIPMKWVTKIGAVKNNYKFVDMQMQGPYALWEHTHTFDKVDGGVMMTDEVDYALPLGLLGQLAHWLLVKKKLENIFDYRERMIKQFFAK
jgi:ligand-binding SRPBCC domain-containing protein